MFSILIDVHPFNSFIFFATVMIFTVVFLNPVTLFLSFAFAVIYMLIYKVKNTLKFIFSFAVPMFFVAALINPIFNHRGRTILFYIADGKPITLESLLYGLMAGLMFASLILWFSSFNKIMTSDKIMYLFGKVSPSISLLISMIVRFVPRLSHRTSEVVNARKCILVKESGKFFKIKEGIKVLSNVTSWSLEGSIDTADSMRARGYDLTKKTKFSLFRMTSRDKIQLITMFLLIFLMVYLTFMGALDVSFFPHFDFIVSSNSIVFFAGFAIFLSTPIIFWIYGEVKQCFLR